MQVSTLSVDVATGSLVTGSSGWELDDHRRETLVDVGVEDGADGELEAEGVGVFPGGYFADIGRWE